MGAPWWLCALSCGEDRAGFCVAGTKARTSGLQGVTIWNQAVGSPKVVDKAGVLGTHPEESAWPSWLARVSGPHISACFTQGDRALVIRSC